MYASTANLAVYMRKMSESIYPSDSIAMLSIHPFTILLDMETGQVASVDSAGSELSKVEKQLESQVMNSTEKEAIATIRKELVEQFPFPIAWMDAEAWITEHYGKPMSATKPPREECWTKFKDNNGSAFNRLPQEVLDMIYGHLIGPEPQFRRNPSNLPAVMVPSKAFVPWHQGLQLIVHRDAENGSAVRCLLAVSRKVRDDVMCFPFRKRSICFHSSEDLSFLATSSLPSLLLPHFHTLQRVTLKFLLGRLLRLVGITRNSPDSLYDPTQSSGFQKSLDLLPNLKRLEIDVWIVYFGQHPRHLPDYVNTFFVLAFDAIRKVPRVTVKGNIKAKVFDKWNEVFKKSSEHDFSEEARQLQAVLAKPR